MYETVSSMWLHVHGYQVTSMATVVDHKRPIKQQKLDLKFVTPPQRSGLWKPSYYGVRTSLAVCRYFVYLHKLLFICSSVSARNLRSSASSTISPQTFDTLGKGGFCGLGIADYADTPSPGVVGQETKARYLE